MSTDFGALRAAFPTTDHWIHFDVARKAPLPRAVENAMRTFIEDIYHNAGETSFSTDAVEQARQVVAELVGASPETLAFVKNTSEGINIVASGLDFRPSDRVLVTDLEHAANLLPWRRLEAKGVHVDTLRAAGGAPRVEAIVEKMHPRTRVVAVSWVTYAHGYRLDIPRLGALCRERGVVLVVDGIQGLGVLDIPLRDLGADVVAAGAHKAMLGLAGTGLFYCREELIERIRPAYSARFSYASDDKWHAPLELAKDAHRFEYGNPNFLGVHVLRHSAELLQSLGMQAIEARVRSLTTTLMERAATIGLEPKTPQPWTERAGIVSFDLPDAAAHQAWLRERGILVHVKDGHLLRASCHIHNNESEIDHLVAALAERL